MNYLLDTHAFLWWIADDPSLSDHARGIISDGANEIYLSTASVWELAIKSRAGKITMDDELDGFIEQQVQANQFLLLPITLPHALRIKKLSNDHRDPFDQMLAAQSLEEGMPLVSKDSMMKAFGAEVVW